MAGSLRFHWNSAHHANQKFTAKIRVQNRAALFESLPLNRLEHEMEVAVGFLPLSQQQGSHPIGRLLGKSRLR